MRQATVIRYSISFKQQVIRELEAGRFQNVSQAREHYGINGADTIPKWLARYGRNHLCILLSIEKSHNLSISKHPVSDKQRI